MFAFRLLKDFINLRALAIVILAGKVNSKFCNGGQVCTPPKECCPLGCCLVFASPGYRPTTPPIHPTSPMSHYFLWNNWLFWILLLLLFIFFTCGCGIWRKRQLFSSRFYRRRSRNEDERSEIDSTGSFYPPPQYSRCMSFNYAPPPYAEVTSKPDLYPLVNSYRSDNEKFRSNCMMVQCLRNYVVHSALGSISVGSNIDRINSALVAHSVREIDSNYLPSYEESRNGPQTELLNSEASSRRQSTHFVSQGNLYDSRNVQNWEIPQIVTDSIHHSIQKASTLNGQVKLRSLMPATFKDMILQGSTQSSFDLHTTSAKLTTKAISANPTHTVPFQKSKIVVKHSMSTAFLSDSGHPVHQYTSDVILAQPQRYCESNSDLHYYSTDKLTNSNNIFHRIDNTCSSYDNISQPRGSIQGFVSSDDLSRSNFEVYNFSTSSEVSSLQGYRSPDSPPQAISPTGEFRNLLQKIQELPSRNHLPKFVEEGVSEYNTWETSDSKTIVQKTEENSQNDGNSTEEKLMEICYLPNEPNQANLNSKRLTIHPNKLLIKRNTPSRSKTFYMPFCHSSLSIKRSNNPKASSSAPVTPVSSFAGSGPLAFNFNASCSKSNSKKNLASKSDGRPLLHNESESSDELF